jgi:hypothetical protein
MDHWRRLTRVSRKDKIPNYVIIEKWVYKIDTNCTKAKQWIRYRHVQGVVDCRWHKQGLEGMAPGGGRRGRPRVRRMEGNRDEMAEEK